MDRVEKTNRRSSSSSKVKKSIGGRNNMLALAAGAGAALVFSSHTRAANLYWSTAASGTWDTTTTNDWSTSGVSKFFATPPRPMSTPGVGDVAVFNIPANNSTGIEVINLSVAQSVMGVMFANTTGTTLQSSSGAVTLTVGSAGISTAGVGGTNGGAGPVIFGSTTPANALNLALNGNQAWTNYTNNPMIFLNGVSDASSSTPVTLTINNFVSATATSGTTFDGAISDNGSGQTSLTVDTGSVGVVTLAATNTYTGNTTVAGGNLLLDFSQSTSPATNIVSSSSALVLGGGVAFSLASNGVAQLPTLILKTGATTDSQTFNNTTLSGGYAAITMNQSGSMLTLGLGTITRNAASTLNFSVVPTSSDIATTSNSNEANGSGILGTWATVGTTTNLRYATVSSGQVASYTSTSDSSGTLASLTSATGNYTTAAAATLVAATPATANTLQFTGSAVSALNLNGNTLTLNGLQQAGSAALTVSNGTIAIGADKELVVTANSIATTVSANIVNSTAGASAVTYSSLGVVTISGTNTYTGTTTFNSGYNYVNTADVAGVSGGLGVGGNITFNGGFLQYGGNAASTDYSSRFKNSTSAIAIDLDAAGRRGVIWNGTIDSSNTGGLVIRSSSTTPYSSLTINGANSFSGTDLIEQPMDLILGNGSALGTSSVIVNGAIEVSASTDLTGANAVANNFGDSSALSFGGIHSIQLTGSLGLSTVVGNNKPIINNIVGGGSLIISGRLNESGNPNGVNNIYFTGIGNTTITGVLANDSTNTGGPSSILDSNTGTLTLSGSNTYDGGTNLYGATLKLDFSAAGAPQNNIIPPSVTGYGLAMTGGALLLNGAAGINNAQTAAQGFTLNAGSSQLILSPGLGGQVVFNANGITNNVGSYLNVTLSGTSNSSNGFTTTSGNDTYGLFKHITIGLNDWANVSSGNVVAYTGYTDQAAVASWVTNQNLTNTVSGAFTGTLPANLTIGSLRFDNNVGGGPNLGSNTLTVGDGILVTSNVNNQALSISGGQIQAASSTDFLVVNNGVNGTTLNIGSTIQNNGTGATALTKAGSGLVILSGTNTYTGTTYLTSGVLEAADSVSVINTVSDTTTSGSTNVNVGSTAGINPGSTYNVFGPNIPLGDTASASSGVTVSLAVPATGSASSLISFGSVVNSGLGQGLLIMNGGVLGLTGNFTRAFGTGPGNFEVSASSAGFAAVGGSADTVNFGGSTPALALIWGTGLGGVTTQDWGANGYGTTMILGNALDTNTVNVLNPMDFGTFSRTFQVDHGSATIDGELSGVLSSASNITGLIKTGLGTLWLNAIETYQGETVVTAGTLTLNGTGGLAQNSTGTIGYSPLTVDGSTAVFDLGANHNTPASTVILDGGGSITGTGTSTLGSPYFDLRNGTVTASLNNSAGSAAPLFKSTAGTVTLSGADTYTGLTNVSAGSLVLASATALPIGANLTIGSGASVVANNLGTRVGLVVGTLSVAGKLDLNNNGLVVHNSSIGTVTTLVASGYNNGLWNGSTGILSTTAANDSTHLTALGVIQNNQSGSALYTASNQFDGVTPLAGDVLVKYTYYGDANLSGSVDGSDYSLIDASYLLEQTSGSPVSGWYNGDFNYDGVVDGSDYTLMDNAYNTQTTSYTAEIASPSAIATAEIAGVGISAVPEPATLGLLGISVAGLLGRRNRRRGNCR